MENVNNRIIILEKAVKPCRLMPYCAYGPLVEDYPLEEARSTYSCQVFDHNCPVFYLAENVVDGDPATEEEMEAMIEELEADELQIRKPCKLIDYCPYGLSLTETFETSPGEENCQVYGHNCPIYYLANPLGEFSEATEEDIKKMFREMEMKRR